MARTRRPADLTGVPRKLVGLGAYLLTDAFDGLLASRLSSDCRVILATNFSKVDARGRQLQVYVFQCVGDYLRDGEVAEPLVIRRDNIPWGVLGAGLRSE